MSEQDVFLDYRGPVDFEVVDFLLNKLKKTKEFKALNKTTAKRTYSLVVECLENICKHSELLLSENPKMYCHLSVSMENDKIVIKSANPVKLEAEENIADRIDHINLADEKALQDLYENKIKSELENDEKCAGLGFIYMALKSGNIIAYSFSPLVYGYLYFELQITLNKYIMRKLKIEAKSNSPAVILDPEKNIYMISGESRPPDVRGFYEPILLWLEEFSTVLVRLQEKEEPVTFNFNFEYFNSSSGKLLLDICKSLVRLSMNGIKVIINWHFEKDDYDMLEAGREMSRIVKYPFEFIETIKS
jgi:hypothetical protein